MIKLVSQFDNEKTKMSLATPTCGACCCCCCCCVVSTITSVSISARCFGDYVAKEEKKEIKNIKDARLLGYFIPLGFMLSFLLGYVGMEDSIASGIIFSLVYLLAVAGTLYYIYKKPGVVWFAIGSCIATIIVEVIGMWLDVLLLSILNVFYFIFAIGYFIGLTYWAFSKKYDNLDKKNKDKK